jgi:hypothetical protein
MDLLRKMTRRKEMAGKSAAIGRIEHGGWQGALLFSREAKPSVAPHAPASGGGEE